MTFGGAWLGGVVFVHGVCALRARFAVMFREFCQLFQAFRVTRSVLSSAHTRFDRLALPATRRC